MHKSFYCFRVGKSTVELKSISVNSSHLNYRLTLPRALLRLCIERNLPAIYSISVDLETKTSELIKEPLAASK